MRSRLKKKRMLLIFVCFESDTFLSMFLTVSGIEFQNFSVVVVVVIVLCFFFCCCCCFVFSR